MCRSSSISNFDTSLGRSLMNLDEHIERNSRENETISKRTVRWYATARSVLWPRAYPIDAIHLTIDRLFSRSPDDELPKLTTIQPGKTQREWHQRIEGQRTMPFTSTNSSIRPSGRIPWIWGPNFRSDSTVQTTLSINNVPRCFWCASP